MTESPLKLGLQHLNAVSQGIIEATEDSQSRVLGHDATATEEHDPRASGSRDGASIEIYFPSQT